MALSVLALSVGLMVRAPVIGIGAGPRCARAPAIRLCDGAEESLEDESFLHAASAERSLFVTDEEEIRDVGKVFALLFNAGAENEGIYSRRLPAGKDGKGGFDIVVTFEDHDDATRYAELLVANDFPSSTPSEVESAALIEFCAEGGHTLGLVRRGVLVMPPQKSVEQFEWSPGESEEASAPLESTAEELDAKRGALEAMLGLGDAPKDDDEDSEK